MDRSMCRAGVTLTSRIDKLCDLTLACRSQKHWQTSLASGTHLFFRNVPWQPNTFLYERREWRRPSHRKRGIRAVWYKSTIPRSTTVLGKISNPSSPLHLTGLQILFSTNAGLNCAARWVALASEGCQCFLRLRLNGNGSKHVQDAVTLKSCIDKLCDLTLACRSQKHWQTAFASGTQLFFHNVRRTQACRA